MDATPDDDTTVSGEEYTQLANRVSEVIMDAVNTGMAIDAAACIAAQVAADYARRVYGDEFLVQLAEIVTERAGAPLPAEVETFKH